MKNLKKFNTGYEIILYDNQDIYKIVRDNFPQHEQINQKCSKWRCYC